MLHHPAKFILLHNNHLINLVVIKKLIYNNLNCYNNSNNNNSNRYNNNNSNRYNNNNNSYNNIRLIKVQNYSNHYKNI